VPPDDDRQSSVGAAITTWGDRLKNVFRASEVGAEPGTIELTRELLVARPGGQSDDLSTALGRHLDELELDSTRIATYAAVGSAAAHHHVDDVVQACVQWLLAATDWARLAWGLVGVTSPDWEPEVMAAAYGITTSAAEALADIGRSMVEAGAVKAAVDVTDQVAGAADAAHVRAVVARAILDAPGDAGDAAGKLIAAAEEDVDPAVGAWWPGPVISLAEVLTRTGRLDEAMTLVNGLDDPARHNDALDAVAVVLAERGEVDGAREVLADREAFEPGPVLDEHYRLHGAGSAITAGLLQRGDVHGALATVADAFDDVFAIEAVPAALESIGEAIARAAVDDPAEAAASASTAIRIAIDAGPEVVLQTLAAMAQVIAMTGEERLAACWAGLGAIDSWSVA
jgi:hypothetical protein